MTLQHIQKLYNHLVRLALMPQFSGAARLNFTRAKTVLETAMTDADTQARAFDLAHSEAVTKAQADYEQALKQAHEARAAAQESLMQGEVPVEMPTFPASHFTAEGLPPEALTLAEPLMPFIQS